MLHRGLFIPNSKVCPDLDYRAKDHARYSTSVMIWIPVESWLRYATQAARRKVIDVHHCFHNELAHTMARIFIFCLKTLFHSNLLKYDYQLGFSRDGTSRRTSRCSFVPGQKKFLSRCPFVPGQGQEQMSRDKLLCPVPSRPGTK